MKKLFLSFFILFSVGCYIYSPAKILTKVVQINYVQEFRSPNNTIVIADTSYYYKIVDIGEILFCKINKSMYDTLTIGQIITPRGGDACYNHLNF